MIETAKRIAAGLAAVTLITAATLLTAWWAGKPKEKSPAQILLAQMEKGQKILRGQLPPRTNPPEPGNNGQVAPMQDWDWRRGFQAGTLKLLALHNEDWIPAAKEETSRIGALSRTAGTHDLGFLLLPGLKNSEDPEDQKALAEGAETLLARFDPERHAIKAWDFKAWEFPIIIDTMPNLELMVTEGMKSGNTAMLEAAKAHAETSWRLLVRPDGSTRHMLDLDRAGEGRPAAGTGQGADENSVWARGQAWALYGWTALAELTGRPLDKERAEKIAAFILSQPESQTIPTWDYRSPWAGDPVDQSAAAINAAALARLAKVTGKSLYTKKAEKILEELSKEPWKPEDHCGWRTTWIQSWRHTGDGPVGSPVGDYYLMEAITCLNPPKTPLPTTLGTGRIKTFRPVSPKWEAQEEGFFCLTQASAGLTARHILKNAARAEIQLGNETYSAKSWRPASVTSNSQETRDLRPENDLAVVELDRPPPVELPRWTTPAVPPQIDENFLVLTVDPADPDGWKWTKLAPIYMAGFEICARKSSRIRDGLWAMMGRHPAEGPGLTKGDSGGPWTQNGSLVAVTSRTTSQETEAAQGQRQPATSFGAGTWATPAPYTETKPPIDPKVLWAALAVLGLAYALQKLEKKRLAKKTDQNQKSKRDNL